MYYTYNGYFAGFSIPQLLSYQFDFNNNKYVLSADLGNNNYLFNTGMLIEITPKFKFFPSVLFNYSPNEKLLFDLNAHFNFLDHFWAGVSYRNGRSFTGLFQFQINNQIRAAYSYDFDLGKLGRFSNGSHEIMLRYEFRYKANLVNPLVF
jgi:type IX secretion system PorP/SprF family membrane protein